jgi:hypothetical protein
MLRLTPDTRHRIYLQLDVYVRYLGDRAVTYHLGGDPAPFTYHLSGDPLYAEVPTPHQKLQPFYGLLLSCRVIYTEVAALLYSAHGFIIRFHPRQSLAPLRALTPHAVASLTNLKIVLNETSCHQARLELECCGRTRGRPLQCGHVWHQEQHNPGLQGSSEITKAVLNEWQATAAYLAPHVVPGRLELSLVCDVGHDEIETAKGVLDALRLLPRLKNCHLRLSGACERPLRALAQDAVDDVCGRRMRPARPADRGPSLMDLPRELRLRILEYTDLITPYCEVLWSRAGGYRVHRGPCYMSPKERLCRGGFHRGCKFSGCYRYRWPPSVGCFCRRDHTAVSSSCRCWAPPAPLFLVCRALRWDAALVFFEKNTFHVVDGPHANPFVPWPPGDYPHDTFAASEFLRRVVSAPFLGHLREVVLAFAPFSHRSKPSFGHPALRDWDETVEWARDKLNLPCLILRMTVPGNGPCSPEDSQSMTQAQGREILAAYQAMVTPLRCWDGDKWGGLHHFCADLAWPLRWARSSNAKSWSWLLARDMELNTKVEQLVLGTQRCPGFTGRVSRDPPGYWRRWSWTWVSLRQESYGLAVNFLFPPRLVYQSVGTGPEPGSPDP